MACSAEPSAARAVAVAMSQSAPQAAPDDDINSVLRRNIRTLHRKREEEERRASALDRLATALSAFAGSMSFVGLNLAAVIFWIAANLSFLPGLRPFDPTFVILATAASVEAIFLSTFILITQNRAAAAADRRSDLDLQISLLTEHEATRILDLCTEIAAQLKVAAAKDPSLSELRREVEPESVLDEI